MTRLDGLPDVHVAVVSGEYETEPWGVTGQPWFLNQVAGLDVGPSWSPVGLLRAMLDIERDMGRVREGGPWAARTIDLDLLLFGSVVSDDPECLLPHPRMLLRAFVLVPLAEIAPALVFPGGGAIAAALSEIAFQTEGNVIRQAEKGLPTRPTKDEICTDG